MYYDMTHTHIQLDAPFVFRSQHIDYKLNKCSANNNKNNTNDIKLTPTLGDFRLK